MIRNLRDIFRRTPIIRVVCFIVILSIVLGSLQHALLYRDRKTDNSSYQIINFYKEKKNDLDVVFVGSSSCFSFYSPLFAYNSYGIKTANYASSGMGMIAFKHVVEEIRKTQNQAPIVVSLSSQDVMNYTSLHYLADYMPMSTSKLGLLKDYFTQEGESLLNSVEYFFPLMRFHERWGTLQADDLILDDGTKGATSHIYYLSYINDITEKYYSSNERAEIPDQWLKYISGLLDYCDENEVELMFIIPPKTYKEDEYKMINSLIDHIVERGYDVLDMREKLDDIGLNMTYDFYDIYHTNVHGSVKYTDYVIKAIMEKYEIPLKEKNDSDFEKAFDTYYEKIKEHVVKEELDMNTRDYHLERPELESIEKTAEGILLRWNDVTDADGYLVYKRIEGLWTAIGDVQACEYLDMEHVPGINEYTVFSYRIEQNRKIYGNYDYRGISIEVSD